MIPENQVTVVSSDPERGEKQGLSSGAIQDGDAALHIFNLGVSEGEVAQVDHQKLLRKIDLHLIPIMCAAMTLFTFDKATLSYSSVMGIVREVGLSSDQYAWLGSIFSLGYLFSNIPCAFIIQKVPLSKWVVFTMSIWGMLLALMAAGHSYGSLFAIRLLLGFFEASITPVFVVMTGMWYTRKEQAFRLGIWYSGVGVATLVGAPLAWAVAGPNAHTGSLSSWRFLFVIAGCITICVAAIFFFAVPDSPLNARFLSPAERVVAVQRIRVNQQGIGNRKFKVYQALELFKDPRTYLYFLLQFVSNIGYGAVGTFGSLLIKSLGYTSREALIITTPHGATTLVGVAGACYLAAKMDDRTLWAGIAALVGVICGGCLYGLENHKISQLAAFYFQHVFVAVYILNFSLVTANTSGHTKKMLTNCVILLGSTSGSLTGPQITKNDESYRKVRLIMMLCPTICIALLGAIRTLNWMENCRRDRAAASAPAVSDHIRQGASADVPTEFLDLTDHENKEFRYSL